MNWRTVQPQSEQPDLRLLVIVVVFAVVGPPIGCVVYFPSLGIVGSIGALFADSGPSAVDVMTRMAESAFGGILFSYFFGFIPAIAAGILITVLQFCMTRVPWYAVLIVGFCVGAGFSYVYEMLNTAGGSLPLARPIVYSADIFTCVASTLICWAMIRNWHTVPRPPEHGTSSGVEPRRSFDRG